jgi:hypothetical protein
MKPAIDETDFGYIVIEGARIEHDVVIRLSGAIKKRKKKLSKAIYGTSHTVSLDEAKHIYEDGAERLIIGSGQTGMVSLSQEAADYFQKKRCTVDLHPTPRAIEDWNKAKGAVIGLFHVTC